MSSRPNAAVRAEPRGIGTFSARDPLRREVKLLGALLGQVIVEQEGTDALDLVERVRRATIRLRRDGGRTAREPLTADLVDVDVHQAEILIRAFSLYFQLTNLAEEKHRVRTLRQRARRARQGRVDDSVAAAVAEMRSSGVSDGDIEALVGRLSITPVLTAHPTEARRRTMIVALRRVYRLLDELDDARITPTEDDEVRRRLREQISILWHVAPVRAAAPGPLDEVRSVMALFDESLFVVAPRIYRSVERALSTGGSVSSEGVAPRKRIPAFIRWGSWVGGDRDGNPLVTSAVTRETLEIQRDHVLRAYEAVCRRLTLTVTVTAKAEAGSALAARLAADARDLPQTALDLESRFPDEPFRRRFSSIAERLRRTRTGEPAGYVSAAELADDLDEMAAAVLELKLARVVDGDLQDLRWQLDTFGFHGLSLEVRQHSEVHAAALVATADADEVAPGVTAGEVLETFRSIADLQARHGEPAIHRYVVSFTRSATDVTNVLELARRACGTSPPPALDVVPLFESADALEGCAAIFETLLADSKYRQHLSSRGNRQEVMLGYSDSTKESGAIASAWLLYRAQERLVAVAHRHGIELTLFHGRGGAIGRGGGPMTRAVLAQAAGSVDGRLKLTEQGEVTADRYVNPAIAARHLEQLTYATIMASLPREKSRQPDEAVDELAQIARSRYRSLVWDDPEFEAYFRAATPIAELGVLALGSRPAQRGAKSAAGGSLESLRAIPWVFAWSQSRANLPGWFGTGTALAEYRRRHGGSGLRKLRALYRDWPFFSTVLDNAEMILAKADMPVAGRYASLASGSGAHRIWAEIRAEYELSVAQILAITEHERLLDNVPMLQRSIDLRNPYVDSLSELQVLLLGRLRALPEGDPERGELLRLVHLTVSGVAAGLQNTG